MVPKLSVIGTDGVELSLLRDEITPRDWVIAPLGVTLTDMGTDDGVCTVVDGDDK